MAHTNLQLLGDHFIQVGNLMKSWNVSERLQGATARPGGARGGTPAVVAGGTRAQRRARAAAARRRAAAGTSSSSR